jgi:hypothetical protein
MFHNIKKKHVLLKEQIQSQRKLKNVHMRKKKGEDGKNILNFDHL